jgi:hypothetical protein
MRVDHSDVYGAVKPVRQGVRPSFITPNSNGSLGGRSTIVNLGHIHQFQNSNSSGASKQDTAVLRHATSAHNTANARDPVVMNILKRTQTQRPVSLQEQKFLASRLLANEKLLAKDEAHKHPADVSYQLDVAKNGNSHVQELVNGRPVYADETPTLGGRSSRY